MKRISALILSLLVALSPALASASTGRIVAGDVQQGFNNILTNSSLDYPSIIGWTSGTGVTASIDSSNYLDGKQSASLSLSSASGALFYQDVTPGPGFGSVNLEAGMWVKTSVAGVQVCPRQGGIVLTGQCVSVPATGTWQQVSANMIGPSSGSMGVALYAASSTTGTVNVDAAYVGVARNLSQVSQAQLIGTVTISGCSGEWTTTSASFGAWTSSPTGCTYTTTGSAVAPAANTLGIKFPSLGAGEYKLEFEGTIDNVATGGNGYLQFWDGTNTARELSQYDGVSSRTIWAGLSQSISESSPQSNVTFSIRGKAGSGSIGVDGRTANAGVIRVYYFPSQSQLTYQANLAPSYAATYISAGTTTTNSTSGSFATSLGVTARTNYGSAQTPGTSGQLAMTVPYVPAGLYLVQAHASMGCMNTSAAGGAGDFKVSDGTSDGGSLNHISSPLNTLTYISEISGVFNYTSPQTNITYSVQAQPNVNGTCQVYFSSPASAQITLIPLSQGVTTPSFVGSVSSNSSGAERVERAFVSNGSGGDCTVTAGTNCPAPTQSGNWIDHVSHDATGKYTFNFVAGMFSASPICTCTSTHMACQIAVVPTTSSVQTAAWNTAGAAVDAAVALICEGPR